MQSEAGMTETQSSKTEAQNRELDPETSKTMPEIGLTETNISLTETNTSNTEGQKPAEERLTSSKTKNKVGRPAKEGTAPVTWSVRGVERDTRAVLEKAAERAGKTMGQYMNDEVRAYAQGQLTQSQLPASPKDLQVQVEQLTQLVEGIAARMAEPARKGFWQRVFGK